MHDGDSQSEAITLWYRPAKTNPVLEVLIWSDAIAISGREIELVGKPSFQHYHPSIMASERIRLRIERLLDQIEQEADQQNWQRVLENATEVLRFAPENDDAKSFLAVAEETLSSTTGQESVEAERPAPWPQTSTSTPAQPSSFADGRYEVKRFLGEGGKKKVYMAHDKTLDRM